MCVRACVCALVQVCAVKGGALHRYNISCVLFTDVSVLQRACPLPDSVTHVPWRKGSATASLSVPSVSRKACAAFMGR